MLRDNPDAVQIGLTVTPRVVVGGKDDEAKRLDRAIRAHNIAYFGEPVVAQGTAADVVARLKMYEDLGFDGVTLRITSWNQRDHLSRLIDEVLPHFQ